MIWNTIKGIFYCGVFHKTKLKAYAKYAICEECGTIYEVIE